MRKIEQSRCEGIAGIGAKIRAKRALTSSPSRFVVKPVRVWQNCPVKNPIIVALDIAERDAAIALAERLAGKVGCFKIGSELFTRGGPELVTRIGKIGLPVFLDLKFHDIPNTVKRAVESACTLGIQMLTIHTSGGPEMMREAHAAAQRNSTSTLVLGVTVLTSMDDHSLISVGVANSAAAQVEKLARLAVECGLGGLVCSPLELPILRQILPPGVVLVTPGIRAEAGGDDQKRTLTAREALRQGANWIVVGRPIYAAKDPAEAAQKILDSID